MTPSEILEFLELPPLSTNPDIQRRVLEKKRFFEQLKQSAPNAVLKNLHTKNLEKIAEILTALGVSGAEIPEASDKVSPSSFAANSSKVGNISNEKNTVAWLIRHTEKMSTKSFPLYEGINLLGREKHQIHPTILLNEDEYVSRQHAKIEAHSFPTVLLYITDGLDKPSKNGTYVNANDTMIRSKVKLQNNDTIQIGMTKFILKINENKNLHQIENEVEESEYMKTIIINL